MFFHNIPAVQLVPQHTVIKIRRILHHMCCELFSGEHALLFDGIQHIHQFLLSDGGLLFAVLLFLEGLHEPQEQKAERGKDDHKDTQHPGKRHRNALGVHLGKALGDNFAEGENDKGGNTGSNRNRIIFEVRSGDHCDQ